MVLTFALCTAFDMGFTTVLESVVTSSGQTKDEQYDRYLCFLLTVDGLATFVNEFSSVMFIASLCGP